MLEKTRAYFLKRFPLHSHPRTARFIMHLTWGTFAVIVLIKLVQIIAVTLFITKC